ncbi:MULTISPECIES: hypothetical protein [Streptomyces]|uniref:Uncharacterized protein n=1 Tax=Streptomyces solicathayae TaxID=3081768 RepID=A0ABZ0M3P2_9ACTN|nr:hypothetical protein [Streptomyces sp. HUAS YS2]WOX26396.1 hypothetical protein R2D22_35495 [Streptomyces sp. HUAS YS2]
MPRSRPRHIRADAFRRPPHETPQAINGLSSRALSEIHHLERTRNYLRPGDVAAAVRRWQTYVRLPERELWHDHEWGNTHWDCCDNDPFEARALLDTVLQALTPRSARQLRQLITRADALWNA